MSLGVNPIDHPDLYDSIILAGRVSPGRARVSMPMRTEGWEKQKAKGADGAEAVNNGADLIEFDVELYLWRDERVDHFEAWEDWSPVLLTPVKAGNPMALDIYHPQLDGLGISSVVVKQRSNPQPDGKGGATVADRWGVGHRIRDVEAGPDGALWMLEDANPGGLYKATPK